MRLQTLPVEVNARAIAAGLLALFDDNERVALRFGLLPAAKMGPLELALDTKFRSLASQALDTDADQFLAVCHPPCPRHVEFSMKQLVAEAVHAVVLELYAIGDLVV